MKKKIVSMVLAFSMILSLFSVSHAIAKDYDSVAAWDAYWSNIYELYDIVTSGLGSDELRSKIWACFDLASEDILGFISGSFDESASVFSYAALEQRCTNFSTSLNWFFREYSSNSSLPISHAFMTLISALNDLRFSVRYDSNRGQYRIYCDTSHCWLVNSYGEYVYSPGSTDAADNSGGLWVKTRDITWDKVTVLPYDSLVSIRDGLIAGGRDCTLSHNGDYWVIHDPKTVETFCNTKGSPFVALWSDSATDIEWNYNDAPTDQIVNIENGTINVDGTIEYVESIEYNTNDQSYTVNSYYYNTTTNEYITNTYQVSYYYDYTYVVNIGTSAMDQESYKFYYDLPDGRNSGDLTMEDLVSLSVNFDIVTYDKAQDTGTLRYLYHFDGDTLPDSYDDAGIYMMTNTSIQYIDAGVFGGAMYLDSNYHHVWVDSCDAWGQGEDIFVMFRYYYSPTQDAGAVPLRVRVAGDEFFRIQGDSYIFLDNSQYTTAARLDGGQWVEYGFWWQSDRQEISFYVNGEGVGSIPFPSGAVYNPSWQLEFPDNGRIFGYLDELRLYVGAPEDFYEYSSMYRPTAVPVDSNLILVLPDTEELNAPTLAVQTGERITGYRIGGVRPSDPRQGQVWAQLENNIITSLQVYNGVSWVECEGRVWTGSRWIPLYAFNVVTMADYFDVIGTYDNSTIHSDSGFWTWFQKSWNDFRSWLDGFKLDNQENWNTLFAYLEEKSCDHNWVLVESVYADYCDSNGHSAITDYIGNSDGGTHQLQSHCTVCSSILSSVSENCVDTNGDGSCDSCSQKMDPCFSGHSVGDIRYTSNNNGSSHTVVNACTVCGDTVSSTTALCTDANEDLICDLCSQQLPDQDPCADGHTVKTSTVANNNMTNHTVIGVCSVCGEEQSRNTVNCSNDGSDHCSVCGQALTACADGHSSGAPTYASNGDKETHTVTVKCSVCQATISTSSASCTDAGGDDLCDLCGQDLSEVTVYYPVLLESDKTVGLPYAPYNAKKCNFDYATGYYYASWYQGFDTDDNGDGSVDSTWIIVDDDSRVSGSNYTKIYRLASSFDFNDEEWYMSDDWDVYVDVYGVTTDASEACDLPSNIVGKNTPAAASAMTLFSLRSTLQGEWKYDLYRCSICGEEYRDYTGEGAPEIEVSEGDDWFKAAWEEFMEIFRAREDNPDVDYDVTIDQDIEIDMTVKDPDQEDGTLSIFDLLKKAIGAGTKMIDFLYQFGIKDALDNFNENMDHLYEIYIDDGFDITDQREDLYVIPDASNEVSIWDY